MSIIARVAQYDSEEYRIFGTPQLSNGEYIAIGALTTGKPVDLNDLVLPTLRKGRIGKAGMIMDTIPVFSEQGALLAREHLADCLQLVSCKTDDGEAVWLGNTLFLIDCIDRVASKAEFYPSNYPITHLSNCVKTAFCLSLFKHAIAGISVFRTLGDQLKLVGSHRFFELFEDNGITQGTIPRYDLT